MASINGIKVADKDENSVTISKEEYENLKSENESLKQNKEKLLGVFSSWKHSSGWNEYGFSEALSLDENMGISDAREVIIKESRKIFNFYAFL